MRHVLAIVELQVVATGRSSMYDEAVFALRSQTSAEEVRTLSRVVAYSWVRRLGVFGCRVVSPGSAIAIGSVKCERVWDSLRALE